MKYNESGMTSLEIIAYVLIALSCILLIAGVVITVKGVSVCDNNINQVEERNN